jgi:hypothetical protein
MEYVKETDTQTGAVLIIHQLETVANMLAAKFGESVESVEFIKFRLQSGVSYRLQSIRSDRTFARL